MTLQIASASGPLGEAFVGLAETLRRSTVHVSDGGRGSGSGVIWRPDGLIITNAHVARGRQADVELADGREFVAEVLDRDERRDLASLRIDALGLPALTPADSGALRVGELVFAMGNPHGVRGSLTIGVVHAIGPVDGRRNRPSFVQADVDLLPGNSGGPLADVSGRVIGINSMVAGDLALAVPSNDVAGFLGVNKLRPRLGIVSQPVEIPVDGERAVGLLILEVLPDTPAERAGLILGDILVGANGTLFTAPEDLLNALASNVHGIEFEVVRGGTRGSREVRFGAAQEGRTGVAA